jgi:hypothetical protein
VSERRCIHPGESACQYDYADDTGESCSVTGCLHNRNTEEDEPYRWRGLTYPLTSPALRKEAVKHNFCPECSGQLDTGWECIMCDFDAREIALATPEFPK